MPSTLRRVGITNSRTSGTSRLSSYLTSGLPVSNMTEQWDPVEDRPYGPVPWHMAGRALAVSLRPKNRALLRQRLPAALNLPDEPIIRVRIWDLAHDAGLGRAATQVLPE